MKSIKELYEITKKDIDVEEYKKFKETVRKNEKKESRRKVIAKEKAFMPFLVRKRAILLLYMIALIILIAIIAMSFLF